MQNGALGDPAKSHLAALRAAQLLDASKEEAFPRKGARLERAALRQRLERGGVLVLFVVFVNAGF